MKPKLCAAGVTLRGEIDKLWPWRDKKSDGWLGDAAHAARNSDHNPDENGIVRAIDVDEDLRGSKKPDPGAANQLVAQLVRMAKGGDERIKYIIFEGGIWSRTGDWKRRKYVGDNPHMTHIHISFTEAGDTDGKKFKVTR